MRVPCFLLYLVLLNASVLQAQRYPYRNLTLSDGLASNEIYDVLEYERGRLLISGDHGLQVYDGQSFRSLPFADESLNGATSFRFYRENPGSRVWINTYRNGLFYIENDTLKPYRHNRKVLEILGNRFVEQFYPDEQHGTLYFIPHGNEAGLYGIDQEGSVSVLCPDPATGRKTRLFRIGKQVLLKTSNQSGSLNPDAACNRYPALNGVTCSQLEYNTRVADTYRNAMLNLGVELWFSQGNCIYRHHPGHKVVPVHCLREEILCLSYDRNGYILAGTQNGAYILDRTSGKWLSILKGHQVNSIVHDCEGSYWLATVDQGLFRIPSLTFRRLDEGQNRIYGIAASDSIVAFFDSHDDLHMVKLWQADGLLSQSVHQTGIPVSSGKSLRLEGSRIWTSGYTLEYTSGRVKVLRAPTRIRGVKDLSVDEGFCYYATGSGAYSEDLHSGEIKKLMEPPQFCTAILATKGRVWIGTDHGVWIVDIGTGEASPFRHDVAAQRISDIACTRNETLFFSTKTNGAFLYRQGVLQHLTTAEGLLSNNCSRIVCQDDSTFWLGTNKGVNRISLRNGTYMVASFGENTGTSFKVNDLAIGRGQLFLATDMGVFHAPLSRLDIRQLPIPFEVEELRCNATPLQFGDTLVLPRGDRNLYIRLRPMTLRGEEGLRYHFELEDHTRHVLSEGRSIVFSDLKPGEYTLHMNVMNFGVRGDPLRALLIVPPHYYETYWFRGSLLAGGFLLILLLGRSYHRSRTRKKQREWQFAMSQFNTLSLQLNPHFIFNSLHTIQYLNHFGESEKANTYVSGLARLTRNILEQSRLRLVSLEQELKNVRLYLEIERLRFEEKSIEVVFEFDPAVDLAGERIPPMLLQPVVENAIWHGLLKKEEDRSLHIGVSVFSKGFRIRVEDNGPGLTESGESPKERPWKTQVGLENIRERMSLYGKMGYGTAWFRIGNRTSKEGEILGVSASFTFLPDYHTLSKDESKKRDH